MCLQKHGAFVVACSSITLVQSLCQYVAWSSCIPHSVFGKWHIASSYLGIVFLGEEKWCLHRGDYYYWQLCETSAFLVMLHQHERGSRERHMHECIPVAFSAQEAWGCIERTCTLHWCFPPPLFYNSCNPRHQGMVCTSHNISLPALKVEFVQKWKLEVRLMCMICDLFPSPSIYNIHTHI
mgnify:CR=1 FL=1